MQFHGRRLLPPLALSFSLLGCAGGGDKGAPIEPPLLGGKADVVDRVEMRGALALDGEVRGELVEDLEFHGYTLDVRAGAVVTLDVTQSGSSRSIDTTLFVYGPMTAGGEFGGEAIAFDDDSGWGRLSRLRDLELADGGRYLVVIGSPDGRGRGRYRLIASCAGECEPVNGGACHPAIADDIRGCVADLLADPDRATSELEAVELCSDAEPVADAYDAVCAAASPPDFCAGSYEEFALTHLPGCVVQLQGEVLDRTCVFGDTFNALRVSRVVRQLRRREIDSTAGLSALDREQIILAVQASSHTDVTTVEEALDRVDQNVINQLEMWDASNRRSFTVYEYGAGDNSYGRLFAFGTADTVGLIGDGDLRECAVTHGPEARACRGDDQCGEGIQCVGIAPETGRGTCVDLAADQHADEGTACTAEPAGDCPLDSGLACAGLGRVDEGLCLPAWMRNRFAVDAPIDIPDGDAGGVSSFVIAEGLAVVDTDVELEGYVLHPDVSQLRVTLTNPAGTEVVVFDGENGGEELILDGPVRGFSGDEQVNGAWSLRVIDRVNGQSGSIDHWAVRLGSRWD